MAFGNVVRDRAPRIQENATMIRHADIWRALDVLAERHGLSRSGLARRAGLDATAFNVSKRINREGKPRWPGTEAIAKVLAATDGTLENFGALVAGDNRASGLRVPVIGLARAALDGNFDAAGAPTGSDWDEIAFPGINDPHAYALEITGDHMEPVFRAGDMVLVSPSAPVRRGDRVVVKTRTSGILARELMRRGARHVELRSIHTKQPDPALPVEDVVWIARIVWASQ